MDLSRRTVAPCAAGTRAEFQRHALAAEYGVMHVRSPSDASPGRLPGYQEGVRTATSKDDTPIAFWTSGQGPSLLLVHGTLAGRKSI